MHLFNGKFSLSIEKKIFGDAYNQEMSVYLIKQSFPTFERVLKCISNRAELAAFRDIKSLRLQMMG